MRLKHAETTTANTPTATVPVHAAPATKSTPRLEPLTATTMSATATTTASTRDLSGAYSQAAQTASAFPSISRLVKGAALGLMWGALVCGVFLANYQIPYLPPQPHLIVFKFFAFLVLSLLLAFRWGWQERNGIRGAVLGVVFGITIVLGFLGGLAVLPLMLPLMLPERFSNDLYLVPFYALLFAVPLGAWGGMCGRAWQARAARSRKNNR